MKLPVLNSAGKELRKIDVDDSVFGIEPNGAVLHQTYVAQRANIRTGSAHTKSRGEVQGSSAKIRRQKYTGRARAGTNRSPTRVGGGIAFGPRPRSYAKALNKKMKRLAIRSALSGKVADGQLKIVDSIKMDEPRTKEIIATLRAVGIERSALIVTAGPDGMVRTSARNLQKTKVLPAAYLNVLDMLNHQGVLMTEEAVKVAEGLWAVKAPAKPEKAAPTRRRAAAKKTAEKKEEAPEPEAKVETEAKTKAPETEKKPAARRRAATKKAEAGTETEEKPKRRTTRARKTETGAAEKEEKPKPRRRTKKSEEGEG